MKYMNQYMAYFDFTTVHNNGRFIGRSGQCAFETENNMLQVLSDVENIKSLCAGFVFSKKPKWKIFMLTITNIKKVNSEQEVKECDASKAASSNSDDNQKKQS